MKQEWKNQTGTLKVYDYASKIKSASTVLSTGFLCSKLLVWSTFPKIITQNLDLSLVQGQSKQHDQMHSVAYTKTG